MIRLIKRKQSQEEKIKTLIKLQFEPVSDTELKALCLIILYSTNNTLTLTPDISKILKQESSITDSAFSTALFRLEKKKLINRRGKTIYISPVFSKLDELEGIMIKFSEQI